MKADNNLIKIAAKFIDTDENISILPLGVGHINDSYKVVNGKNEYVLQRINHNIFKNVEQLQNNILRVTTHIKQKLKSKNIKDIDRRVLTIVPTKDNKLFYKDDKNEYWRIMYFIKDTVYIEEVNSKSAYNAGVAFGEFQKMMSDLPGEPLFETIKDFHNIEFRLKSFRDSVKKDNAQRVSSIKDLIDEIESRADYMCKAEKLHREGLLPKRTNHCDTKVNNILFDLNGDVLCVVDLDTVMPGYVLSDFGDFIRTGANTGKEDDKDLDKISINLEIFEAYAKGYLKTAKEFLCDTEIKNLAFGAKLLTYMQTVRFLTDYIDGDTYYKTKYKEHNLVRTKAQFKLLQNMEENFSKMEEIVNKWSNQ